MPSVVGQYMIPVPQPGREHTNEDYGIREVWRHNLENEFYLMRNVALSFKFVAMDTEFPGVVAKPIGTFESSNEYQYQLLKCNVDLLKIIQLGLSFFDDSGCVPPGISTFQFNFKFNLSEDMYAQDSIDLLQNSGLKFKRHLEEGIDPSDFAELLMTSGIVIHDDIKFLSFHSGYDFGYLMKILTNLHLPTEESKFFEMLNLFFPVIYDVKYLMKSCKNLKGGLQEVSEQLELERVGPQHQAGSDSLLTGMTFFKMREIYFEGLIDDEKYCGHLYGLGTQHVVNGTDNSVPSPPLPAVGVIGGGPAPQSSGNAPTNTNNTPTSAVDGSSDAGSDSAVNNDANANGHDSNN